MLDKQEKVTDLAVYSMRNYSRFSTAQQHKNMIATSIDVTPA